MAVCEITGIIRNPDGTIHANGVGKIRLISTKSEAPGMGVTSDGGTVILWQADVTTDASGALKDSQGGPLMLRPNSGFSGDVILPDGSFYELVFGLSRLRFLVPDEAGPRDIGDLAVPSSPISDLPISHSTLSNLSNDDHPIYLKTDGSRSADLLNITGDLTVGGRVFGGPEVAATTSDPLPGDVRLIAAGRVLRIRERPADIDPDAKEANLGLWVEPDVDGEFVVIDRVARFGGLRRRLFVRDLPASRDLAVTDLGALIAGAGVTITVPDDATLVGAAGLPTDWLVPGVFCDLVQTGPAPLVVEAGAGVTLVGSGAGRVALGWEGATARLIRLDTDRWVVMGQTAAAAAGLQQVVTGRWTTVPWGTGATGSINPALAELVAVPLPTRGGTVDAVAVERMGSQQTGCSIRIGVYDSRGGMPGRLIAELGSWLVEAVTVHTLTLASPVTLPPGRLWLATVVQGAAGAFRGWTAAASYSGAPTASPSFQVDGLARFGSVSGALPSSLEGAVWAERNTSVVVHLRGAS